VQDQSRGIKRTAAAKRRSGEIWEGATTSATTRYKDSLERDCFCHLPQIARACPRPWMRQERRGANLRLAMSLVRQVSVHTTQPRITRVPLYGSGSRDTKYFVPEDPVRVQSHSTSVPKPEERVFIFFAVCRNSFRRTRASRFSVSNTEPRSVLQPGYSLRRVNILLIVHIQRSIRW
jgi:hypothetical protein